MIRILLSPNQGYFVDLSTFTAWFQNAAENGLHSFYETWSDYPPFNVYIFWVFGSLANYMSLFNTDSLLYLLKLPSGIFDVATSALIFLFLRKRSSFKASIFASSLYAFNPATIFNTSIWGQYDAIYTFFLVLAIMLVLDSKPKLSAVAYALALLTKPQSIALAPLMIYYTIKRYGWEKFGASLLALAATIFVVIIPFEWSNPVTFLLNIYSTGYGGYAFNTINAFNIWAFIGFWIPDTQSFLFLNFFTIGWILFTISAISTLFILCKRFDDSGELLVLFSAFMLLFSFFMLPTRIHERYMFPVLSFLALMFPFFEKIRPVYYILSFTYLMNQVYVLYFLNAGQFIPNGDPVVFTLSLINSFVFLYVSRLTWKEFRTNRNSSIATKLRI